MQSQMINNIANTPVHVKVALNGEFRRFLLNPLTYVYLESTVKTLFNITAPVALKFQDDEKDWVHLTTDAELLYAIELAGNPLRVDVKILAGSPVLTQNKPIEDVPTEEGWRCRGKRGGRGGCVGVGRPGLNERLDAQESRVKARITELQEKADSGKLPSERERAVRWKITRLQEKLEFIAVKRASLPAKTENTPTECCNEVTEDNNKDSTPQEEEKWGRRGGRGGCRGRRGACGGEGWAKPRGGLMKRLPPEVREQFLQCKTAWKAAKESGNTDDMAACKEAFIAAKQAKMAALATLRAQDAAAAGEEQENKAGTM